MWFSILNRKSCEVGSLMALSKPTVKEVVLTGVIDSEGFTVSVLNAPVMEDLRCGLNDVCLVEILGLQLCSTTLTLGTANG